MSAMPSPDTGDKPEPTGVARLWDDLAAHGWTPVILRYASHGVRTIAFPSISTGAYGFPPERAAQIAVATVKDFTASHPAFERVVFVVFNEDQRNIYEELLKPSSGR